MVKNYDELYRIIAPHISDVGQVPLIKQSLIYQLVADKFNIFVCGTPSSGAKTSYKNTLEKVAPSFKYFSFTGHGTKIGLSQVIRALREGILHIDELGRSSGNDRSILRDVLQNQVLKIDKFGEHKNIPAKINVFATTNPKGKNDKWESYGNPDLMREQIPIGPSFYRRFHISIFTEDYNEDDFDKVNRHKVKTKNPYVKETDLNWAKKKIADLKNIKPKFSVPEKIFNWLKKLKYFDDLIVMPITNEIVEGVVEVAKANAKLRESEKVINKDWKTTRDYFVDCFRTGGLTNDLIKKELKI